MFCVALTYVNPAGRVSVTTKLFVVPTATGIVIRYVATVPIAYGGAGVTVVLPMCSALIVTLALSLPAKSFGAVPLPVRSPFTSPALPGVALLVPFAPGKLVV